MTGSPASWARWQKAQRHEWPHLFSVCSGIEAASVAWEPHGFRAVGFSEIEPFPSAVLAARYGANMPGQALVGVDPQTGQARPAGNGVPNHGDFTRIDPAAIPAPLDVLVGGTPCQAFSIAGRRLSLADARGNLSLAFVVLAHGLARSHGLRNIVWENVPGVLNTADNAFGCFLGALVGADEALPAPAGGGWPCIGMVAGPAGRAAWRVLDAQYFGLAQRRRRVFLVADLGGGADPATVLFERQGLRGHPPARGEARQGAAAHAGAGAGERRIERGGVSVADLAPCLGANSYSPTKSKGADGELEFAVAHTLRADGFDASEDGTGRGTPLVPVAFPAELSGTQVAAAENISPALGVSHTMAVAFSAKDSGADAADDLAPTLRAGGHTGSHANAGVMPAVAYAIQERAVSENPDAGPDGVGGAEGIGYTLEARSQVQAVAFVQNTRNEVRLFGEDGETVGALAAEPGAKQQFYLAELFTLMERGREGESNLEFRQDGTANAILTPNGGRGGMGVGAIAQQFAVRRLTPTECERLQGFPDGWTQIAWRSKPAEACPDGPRYKALGNSMAVPVMGWIGARLAAALPARPDAGEVRP